MLTKLKFVENTGVCKFSLYAEEVWYLIDLEVRRKAQLWVLTNAQDNLWEAINHVGGTLYSFILIHLRQGRNSDAH